MTVRLPIDRTEVLADKVSGRFLSEAVRLVDPSPDHLRMRIPFDWVDEAVIAALRLGGDAEVVEPEWLRRSIVAAAEAILAGYREGSAAGRTA
jgi:predicted DNA-binding transcriptional regulator YafY